MIERVNLLPREDRAARRASTEARWFLLLTILGAAVLTLLGLWGSMEVTRLEGRRAGLVAARTRLDEQQRQVAAAAGRIRDLRSREAALQARLQALQSLEGERIRWSRVLARVSRLVPDGTWLTGMGSSLQPEVPGAARGLRFSGRALSHARVSDFLEALEDAARFSRVEILSLRRGLYEEREIVDFEVACRYQRGGEGEDAH